MRVFFILASWILTAQVAFSADLAQKPFHLPNTEIDVASYELHLRVPEVAIVDLEAELVIRLKALSPLRSVQLHATQGSIEILGVKVNGAESSAKFANDYVLEIALPAPLAAAEEAEIKIAYVITKDQLKNSGRKKGLFYSGSWNGIELLAVENWPYFNRTWIPSNDHPEDPASFDITVDVPKGVKALSNGELVEVQKTRSYDRFHWKTKTEFPTYGLNLVVGKYEEFEQDICFSIARVNNELVGCAPGLEKLKLHYFAPNNGRNHANAWKTVQTAARSVAFFSSVLGKYRFEKVAFISAPQTILMEYPSLITSTFGSVHEIAHHWFGDSVRIAHWGDLWISEGFTTYLDEVLYADFIESGEFEADTSRRAQFNFPDGTDPLAIFDDGPYHGGASAIAKLRKQLNGICPLKKAEETARFYAVLRSIYQSYAMQPLGTGTLLGFLEETLPGILREHGCETTNGAVAREVATWSEKWLSL